METIPAGVMEVWFVPNLTSETAPSAAEINAGTRLTTFIQAGPDFPETGQVTDAGNMSSAFNSQRRSTYGGDIATVELLRHVDVADDGAWTTLAPAVVGHIVKLPFGVGGTGGQAASGDRADVYPIEVVSRSPMPPVRGDLQKDTVALAVTAPPTRDAAVAV